MRLSAKGRYALVAMTDLAQCYDGGKSIAVISIAEKYGISKIYLEQVFSLLKRSGLVLSVKGFQGGYQLLHAPGEITAFDVLLAIEGALFEEAEDTVSQSSPATELALRKLVLAPLDEAIAASLRTTTLLDLANEANAGGNNFMFYI